LRLVSLTTLVGAIALVASTAAFAGWGIAGIVGMYRIEEPPVSQVCGNGIRAHLAMWPASVADTASYSASHPFTGFRMTTRTNTAQGTIVGDQLVVLPRNPVLAGTTRGDVMAYSGWVLLPFAAPLAPGTQVDLHPHDPNYLPLGATLTVGSCTAVVLPIPLGPVAPSCFGATPTITGTSGNDVLTGTPGPDVIMGGDGNDTIDGLGGDDLICGGNGDDTLVGGAGNDGLDGGIGIDTLDGSSGNDYLTGGLGDDSLTGGSGEDLITGEGGNDKLNGGPDTDALDGGAGTDSCQSGETLVGCEP
jgi:Ca2+-binding RTX toxin-like protein